MKTASENLLLLQVRVLATLTLRETRATFGASRFGYLWTIIVPTCSVALLCVLFAAAGRRAPFGQSLALFFATGILTVEFFSKLSSALMTAFEANKALTTYPLVKETDALFARAILTTLTYMLIMALFYGALAALGLADAPHYPERIIAAIGATAWLGFGFGTVNAVLISLWPSWQQIERVLTRPLIFVSAVFYIPSFLPPAAQAALWWNPVLHLVEWTREGVYPNYDSGVLSPAYPLAVAAALTLIGLASERGTRNARNSFR